MDRAASPYPRVVAVATLVAVVMLGGQVSISVSATPAASASTRARRSWSVVGPGGGGAQFLPTPSPHDPNRLLVSCDMTGAYLTNDGGASFRMFNLRGRVRFFVFDPVEPDTFYAQTIGLFRTRDAGKSWALVQPAPSEVTGVDMANDHAGETILTARGPADELTALAIDPADSSTLYAALDRGNAASLQVSHDRGATFAEALRLHAPARKIYVDPRSARLDRTLYFVDNGGVSVLEASRMRRGAPPPSPFLDVSGAFPPRGPLVLYGVAAGEVFVSSDGGASWQPSTPGLRGAGDPALPRPELRSVAVAPDHPDVAYVSYSGLRLDSSSPAPWLGVARTTDRGGLWSLVWKESSASAPNVDGAWISRTFSPDWGENPLDLGVAASRADVVYASDMARTVGSRNGGETWEPLYSRRHGGRAYSTTGLDVTVSFGVHFDPFNPRGVLISSSDIGLLRSDDGGVGWAVANKGVPAQWANTAYWAEFDPALPGRVWVAMSGTHDLPRPKMWRRTPVASYRGGVCKSEDGGFSFQPVRGLPEMAVTHILLDPRSPRAARVLYVAGFGKGVFRSRDGGETWTLARRGLEGDEPLAFRLSLGKNGTLYLVVARRSEDDRIGTSGDGALYRSIDGADSWEKMSLPEGVNGPNGLAIDPQDPERLYLAAWGRPARSGLTHGGVYLSIDGGRSWSPSLSADQHIYDVTVDARAPGRLYAAGFESSAWRSTDRGTSWQRIRGFNFKWAHRVIPDPVDPSLIYVTTFGGGVWHGPAEGDPEAREDIVTAELPRNSGPPR